MSDAERVVEVKRLVEHWLPHMGLENWRVFVQLAERKDKLDANAMLTIRIDGAGYQRASILVAPNLPEERWSVDLERDVVHELCHIPLDKTDDVAWAAGEIWQKAYRKAEEGVIDQFAAMLTRLHDLADCHQ